MNSGSSARIAFALALIAGATPALAEPQGTPAEPGAGATVSSPFAGQPVADEALGAVAGKQNIEQLSEAEHVAVVSNNSVGDQVSTGEVRIADNAFQNMSGLSMVNVNTGNNVAMNASMNVNIAISPPQ